MKKLLTLAFAFVFMTGVAFAQSNDASTTQEVDDSEITIDQVGSQNEADVSQILGNDNMLVNLDQEGSSNDASVTQQYGQWHEAQVSQAGSGNELTLLQDNTSTLANVTQEGDNNEADIYQRNYSFAFGTYSSRVDLLQDGNGNDADIDMDGFRNFSDVSQIGDENQAFVTQDGDDNSVLIEQGVFGGASETVADFTQEGDGNYFETKQVRSLNNSVTGTQVGDNNYYRASLRGSDNTVTMDMVGDANRGSWSIGSLGWPHQPEGNTLTIDVDGDDNYSTGSIKGDYNTVDITQHGLGNRIGSSWYTTDGVTIEGSHNTATIMQTSDMNSAVLSQMGNSNTATITQSN
ncbi:MAG: hypothetical protein GVY15_05500 [Bacteroidetes bacterium]|jgi:hypothetical protein|nr:hypothetical protein [Bacteroidota bacterium]